MKKAWIFLIALALLAFSMPIFADAPAAGSFHAWNQGDFYPVFAWGSNGASSGWGPTWDGAQGIDQEWTFSYDGNNYGFNATFEFGGDQFDAAGATSPGQPISWFATYYKFGDLVKVTIGKPRFNDYTDFTTIEGQNFKRFGDSDFMGIVQVFPVSGLSIAAALYTPSSLTAGWAWQNAESNLSADYGNNFGIAGSYAVPNVATVKVLYRANESTLGDSGTASKYVSGSVSVSAVKGLTAAAGVQANLTSSSNTIITAWLSGGSSMFAPLTINADFAIVNQPSPSQTAYFAEVQGEYVVAAPWSFGVQLGYDGGSATGVHVGWFDGGGNEWSGLQIWPYLKAAFDNGSSFKVGFMYASADRQGNSNAVIAIPIIYVWAF